MDVGVDGEVDCREVGGLFVEHSAGVNAKVISELNSPCQEKRETCAQTQVLRSSFDSSFPDPSTLPHFFAAGGAAGLSAAGLSSCFPCNLPPSITTPKSSSKDLGATHLSPNSPIFPFIFFPQPLKGPSSFFASARSVLSHCRRPVSGRQYVRCLSGGERRWYLRSSSCLCSAGFATGTAGTAGFGVSAGLIAGAGGVGFWEEGFSMGCLRCGCEDAKCELTLASVAGGASGTAGGAEGPAGAAGFGASCREVISFCRRSKIEWFDLPASAHQASCLQLACRQPTLTSARCTKVMCRTEQGRRRRTLSSPAPSVCHGSGSSDLHFGECSCTC